jgi:putative transposase
MPRPARLNLPGIPQHITQRGNNRQACSFANADYDLYLALLAEACRKHQCAVHAYVLMTNHGKVWGDVTLTRIAHQTS